MDAIQGNVDEALIDRLTEESCGPIQMMTLEDGLMHLEPGEDEQEAGFEGLGF